MLRTYVVSALLAGLQAVCTNFARAEDATTPVSFNRQIRPILSDSCFPCHGPDADHREADLRLDRGEDAVAARGGTPAIVPGSVEQSEVWRRITSEDESLRMPPAESGKELSAEEIELIGQWIAEGSEYEPHWSFIPPKRPEVPQHGGGWAQNDIDRFLLARWEPEGVGPSPDADPRTLVRRVCLDLTGLPPTREQVERFLEDDQPGAWGRLVDRLLASPRYGERVASYWLDLVRYANSVGYHGDQEHAIAPYRDWVIKAFNDNMPFDQFTVEQLAGDLLPEATTNQLIATGYNRVLQTSHEGGVQQGEYLHKYDADRIRNLSGVWMGATLGCAECHNHKYDPYTQKDFYRLVAFFADVDDLQSFRGGDTTPTKREPERVVLSPLVQDEVDLLKAELESLEAEADQADNSARIEELRTQIEKLESQTQRTMVTERIEPRVIRVLDRGDWMDTTGEIVEPAVPEFMPQIETGDRRATRLDLARWLTSAEHPQTSRVFVNRLWYLLFGRGLSSSLDDNGAQGAWPDHPELLDWLAVEFVESGWDVEHMVRLIATSRAYRQSSLVSEEQKAADPENRLFARQSRPRIPAEMVRDSALQVSGLLVDRLGGATSHPYQPAGYYKPLNFPKRTYIWDSDENQFLRGVYVHWQRQYLHPMLRAFDAPSREECTARRPVSNTPLAALVMLNDPTMVEAARGFAERILREGGTSADERIGWAWQTALSRPPSEQESTILREHVDALRNTFADDPSAAGKLLDVGITPPADDLDPVELAIWTEAARAIFNVSEFITRN